MKHFTLSCSGMNDIKHHVDRAIHHAEEECDAVKLLIKNSQVHSRMGEFSTTI